MGVAKDDLRPPRDPVLRENPSRQIAGVSGLAQSGSDVLRPGSQVDRCWLDQHQRVTPPIPVPAKPDAEDSVCRSEEQPWPSSLKHVVLLPEDGALSRSEGQQPKDQVLAEHGDPSLSLRHPLPWGRLRPR